MSLAKSAPELPGRLTDSVQPAGFEALAGLTAIKVGSEKSDVRSGRPELLKSNGERRTPNDERQAKAALDAADAAAKEAARAEAERKKHNAAVKDAEAAVARAEMKERSARETWEHAHDELLEARRGLTDVKTKRSSLKAQG